MTNLKLSVSSKISKSNYPFEIEGTTYNSFTNLEKSKANESKENPTFDFLVFENISIQEIFALFDGKEKPK